MNIKTIEQKDFKGNPAESILNSALKADLVFEYSCKTGQCGVCKSTLIHGEVVELQEQIALSELDKESRKILTCCCAPKTTIIIDAEDLTALHRLQTKTLPARINSIIKHTSEIVEITLRLPPAANFQFLEGQYLDVILGNIRRSYSIASTANQKEINLLIKRFAGGKMSDYWFNDAQKNDLLRIEGPKGTFFLRAKNKPLLFLATGTGIAPIMSILKALENDKDYVQKNPIFVYWGNRYSDEFVWKPNFKKLQVQFNEVCSRPDKNWLGKVGYVQDLSLKDINDIANYEVYACGSNAMIRSAKQLFLKSGLQDNQFYSDAFVQSF